MTRRLAGTPPAIPMRSPENARRLLGSIQRLEAGEGEQHDLTE